MLRLVALATTLIAQLAWVGLCLYQHPPRIEGALLATSTRDLVTAGFADIEPHFHGRDAELLGMVATADLGSEAERLVRNIPGVRNVVSRLTVRPAPEPAPVLPYLEIHSRAGAILLKGSVPSAEQRQKLAQKAAELFGEERLDDLLVVDETAEDGVAMARAVDFVSIALQATEASMAGAAASAIVIRLRGDGVRLSGRVESQAARRRIEALAQAAAPDVRVFFSALEVANTSPESQPLRERGAS